MLVTEPYLKQTKSVRHILFNIENYDSDEACKAAADSAYAEYLEDPTEDHFAELANEYSEDPGNDASDGSGSKNGGLYEGLSDGDTVTEFNDWTFDPSRKPGDTDIVKTQFGYHIMYFVKDNSLDTVRSALLRNKFEEYKASFEVTFDEDTVYEIEK